MTVNERLERLERDNRWMRRAGAGLLAAIGAVLLMGQGKAAPGVVEARAFVLVDAEGERCAVLGSDDGNRLRAGLTFLDASGNERAALALSEDGLAALTFRDAERRPRVHLGTTWEATDVLGCALILRGGMGGKIAHLVAWGETVSLSLGPGKTRVVVHDDSGAWRGVMLYDEGQWLRAHNQCKTLYDVVSTWRVLTKSALPSDLRELEKPIAKSTDEPFWRVERDPWGHDYRIESLEGTAFRIWSNGPDGEEATDDDLCYPPR